MERSELVVRRRCDKDRRVIYVDITAKGSSDFRGAFSIACEAIGKGDEGSFSERAEGSCRALQEAGRRASKLLRRRLSQVERHLELANICD